MRTSNPAQELTEQEAAEALGIRVADLYRLLDEHIFNNGTPRPSGLLFNHSDLLLLSVWSGGKSDENLLRMPRRH
jgi:hypothetical protein